MRTVKIFAAFAVAFLSHSDGQMTDPFTAKVGDKVCFEGYIMDNFCIKQGFLFDHPNVISLEGPDVHTVMCLVDVPSCVESNFEILMDPSDGSKLHGRAYQFDDENGKQDVVRAIRSVGNCTSCDPGGSLKNGFRAEIRGTVVTARDGDTPALIRVESVQPSNNLTTTVCAASETTQNPGGSNDNKSHGDAMKIMRVLSVTAAGMFSYLIM